MLVLSGSSSAWKLLEPDNARLEASSPIPAEVPQSMFWSRIIYLVTLLVWNLCFLGVHLQPFFAGYSQTCKHFTCQPLKETMLWWFPPAWIHL